MIFPLRFHRLLHGVVAASLLLPLGTSPTKAADPSPAAPSPPVPKEFQDPDTGARIIHLSTLPNDASGVIYFTQDCITPDNRYAVVRYLDASAGHTAGHLYRYDFTGGELVKLTDRMTKNQVMFAKSGNVYYSSDDDRAIYATNIRDLKTRKVADVPPGITCSGGLTVNADETLVVGTGELAAEHVNEAILTTAPNHGAAFGDRFNRHDTQLLIGFDVKTGKFTELHRINTWLGHVQFSPTDPTLLMFCHEGPWDKVDRMWTLRVGANTLPQLVLKRTDDGEIAGHEFWSVDGSTIWYDHSFRRTSGKRFLEGKNLATGAVTQYPITADTSSIHYTQSPDGKFFVADGGTRKDHPERQSMFILVPENGQLRVVKICSMTRNDYAAAEPNPHLTPDQHRIIFTATFFGTPQAYAVETPKDFWR